VKESVKKQIVLSLLLTIEVLLAVVGVIVVAFSYTQLTGQDVIFNKESIPIDAHSYVSYEIIVNLTGKIAPKVTGGVGSVGSDVDFYLVNDTSWNTWSTNPEMRSTFSMVHLNATAISSQLVAENQFSFTPSTTAGYSVVFVNNVYPSASNTSVHATINLQYTSLNELYDLVVGLVMLAASLVLLSVTALRRIKQ